MNQKTMQTICKCLSLLLAVAILLTMQGIPVQAETTEQQAREMPQNPVHHCTKQNDGTDITDWSYVYFGSYPQTEVTGDMLTPEITGASYDTNGDAWVDGAKYRRISKNNTNYNAYFGDSDYRYFKWERIKWRVLQNDGSTLFVIADKGLDCKVYNPPSPKVYITWENCKLRNWLNTSFYDTAFSKSEQGAVVEQVIVNEDNIVYGIEGGNDTSDKVYLLSIGEALNPVYGFCKDPYTYSVSRCLKASDYAHAMGAIVIENSGGNANANTVSGNCLWWLRSPGNYENCAANTEFYGSVDRGGDVVDKYYHAVAPVLHINLSSEFWSLEDDGKIPICAEHNWSEGVITKVPTCKEAGKKEYTCTVCGEKRTEEMEIPHIWDEGKETKAPTCKEKGEKEYTCTVCGEKRTEEMEILHIWDEGKETKAPTCKEKGEKEYTCTVCGEKKTEEMETKHTWDEGKETKVPTCKEKGEKEYICTVCGKTKIEEVKTTDKHTWDKGKETKAPTYEEKGEKEYTCTICGKIKTEEIKIKLNPVHHCIKEGSSTETTDWSYIYFGSYPQTEITGNALTPEITGASYDANGDAWVDGTKYRRLSKRDTNNNRNFGSSSYRYFKWEHIKWRVLQNDGSTLFVAANKGLDGKDYNKWECNSITWEGCTLRNWLNTTFYDMAFDSREQGTIVEQTVENKDNPHYGTEGGNNTSDKVYLLSIEEVLNPAYGFCSRIDGSSGSRRLKASDYAYVMGVQRVESYAGSCDWWLRSPGSHTSRAAGVFHYGIVARNGGEVYGTSGAVVPALHINLSSDLWSLADDETVCTEHNWSEGVVTKAPTCKEKGEKEYTCTVCRETKTEEIEATGNHTWDKGKETKVPTCKEKGEKEYTCMVCGEKKHEELEKISHTYKTVVIKATTAKCGSITEKCTVCGDVKGSEMIFSVKSAALKTTSYIYSGKAKKPSVTVKDSSGKVISKDNYTVVYKNNTKVGKAIVTVKLKGNYAGTLTKAFTILPKGTSVSGKITASSQAFTIKWKKQMKSTTGYQIQYSTNKKFAKKATVIKTVKKSSPTKLTIKKLKPKQKYYVRIRTYKAVKGKKYCSDWSKVKTVTTRK